jgi:hypothetical protein
MNCDMTARTALVVRINHAVSSMVRVSYPAVGPHSEVAIAGVAFQALLGHGWAREQLGIRGTMRFVATDAAIDLASLMLEHEGSALVDVAFQAWLFRVVRLVEHLGGLPHTKGGSKPAVRVVAVAASHEALIDAVLKG